MNLRPHFINGFLKAASLSPNGPTPPPSIPKEPVSQPAPSALAKPPMPYSGFSSPSAAAGHPAPIPAPAPTAPNPYAGWELRGHSGSGGVNNYTYYTPNGWQTTNKPVQSGDVEAYNNTPRDLSGGTMQPHIEASVAKPQPASSSSMIQAMRQASKLPNNTSPYNTNGYGMPGVAPESSPEQVAGKIDQDEFAQNVVPRFSPASLGKGNQEGSYNNEVNSFKRNMSQNREMLSQIDPDLAAEGSSSDPGLQEQAIRKTKDYINNISVSNPQLAQQLSQLFFGQHQNLMGKGLEGY